MPVSQLYFINHIKKRCENKDFDNLTNRKHASTNKDSVLGDCTGILKAVLL